MVKRTLREKIREARAMNSRRKTLPAHEACNLAGKVALITGATDGIGKATALKMAALGARLYLLGRDPDKCHRVVEDIRRHSGNNAIFPLIADLSDQADVRAAAMQFLRSGEPLHILVNNAGVFGDTRRRLSADGHELHFAVNYLAPFTLTALLLERLTASGPARILNVVSEAYIQSHFELEDYNAERDYRLLRQYGFSKLCTLLFSLELARRLHGRPVAVNCMHPGLVHTAISKNRNALYRTLLQLFCMAFARSAEDAADDYVYLCAANAVGDCNGTYFYYTAAKILADFPYGAAQAQALLALSERLTGIQLGLPAAPTTARFYAGTRQSAVATAGPVSIAHRGN
jgi:retinol dehydrogenase 12